MNLNKLRDKAYQCTIAHGWHEENLSDKHFPCLVISELMEAVEADRKGRHANRNLFEYYMNQKARSDDEFIYAFKHGIKDTVEDELSDAFIRLLDLAGLRGIPIRYSFGSVVQEDKTFTENIYYIISELTNPKYTSITNIGYVLNQIQKLADMLKIDILWHIEQKMKYNELRPYKHGNKNY